MTRCRFELCLAAGLISLALLAPAGKAQQNKPPAQAPPPPQVNPSTQAAIAAQAAQAQAAPPTNTAPDYPEPRGLTIELLYWTPLDVTAPGIFGGSQLNSINNLNSYNNGGSYAYIPGQPVPNETLTGLGKPKRSPGINIGVPITRTGEIHVDVFRITGDGNLYAPAAATIFSTAINQGDYLATNYKVTNAKIYLDDLLFPHKFPVARFRLKSLWAFDYLSNSININAPLVPVTVTSTGEMATGAKHIFLPMFGLAAEYAPAPHLLLRVDASGFGILHRSDIWDGNATVSYRIGSFDIVAGARILHFKSSPNSTEYTSGNLPGAFIGVKWHAPFFERER